LPLEKGHEFCFGMGSVQHGHAGILRGKEAKSKMQFYSRVPGNGAPAKAGTPCQDRVSRGLGVWPSLGDRNRRHSVGNQGPKA
jgi:hypothetical protein